ncbi:hypothetical protein D3C76_1523890 [compost metagenome]
MVVRGGGRAADTEQAEAGNRPGRRGTAGHPDAGHQLIQRGHFVEGETGEGGGVILGVPQGTVFADEHHVTADAGLVHGEEVADGDLFP